MISSHYKPNTLATFVIIEHEQESLESVGVADNQLIFAAKGLLVSPANIFSKRIKCVFSILCLSLSDNVTTTPQLFEIMP